MTNGAGYTNATMDSIVRLGGKPANFMDLTGNALHEQMMAGLTLLEYEPTVKVIFINIFGGMVDCFKVMTSIKYCARLGDLTKPVVIRMKGMNSESVTGETELPQNMQFIDDWEEATLKCIEIAANAEVAEAKAKKEEVKI